MGYYSTSSYWEQVNYRWHGESKKLGEIIAMGILQFGAREVQHGAKDKIETTQLRHFLLNTTKP